ncbi:MAG: cation-transporting P-type ATPase [Candidatus Aenigmatarchaeota archaeon]
MVKTKWHVLKTQDVLKKLNTKEQGITDYEASIRKDRYGANLLEEYGKKQYLILF